VTRVAEMSAVNSRVKRKEDDDGRIVELNDVIPKVAAGFVPKKLLHGTEELRMPVTEKNESTVVDESGLLTG